MYPFTSPNGQSASTYATPNPPVYGSPTYQTTAYGTSGSNTYQSIPNQTSYSVNHGYLNQSAPSIPGPSATYSNQSQAAPYMTSQHAGYLPQQPGPYEPQVNYGSQSNPAPNLPNGYAHQAATYLPPGNHRYQNHTQPSSANTLSFSFSFQSNTPSAAPIYRSQASHGHNGNLAYTNQSAINSPSVNPGYQYQATPTSANPGYQQLTAPYGPSGKFGHQCQAHNAPANNHSHQISQLYSHLTSPSCETQRTPYTPASNVPRLGQAQTTSRITSPDFFHQNQTPYVSSGNLANRSQAALSPSSDVGYETMLSPESGLSNMSQISSPRNSGESRNLITIPISPPEKLTEYLLKFNQAALLQTKPQQPKEAKTYREVKNHSTARASATIAMERKIHRKPAELPTSAIHYKFKATNENQLIRFNDQCLSVAELKIKIIEKIHNSTKDINFDLQILHEQNETPYKDEDLIQRNMSVIVVRVPKPKTRRGPKTWNQEAKEFVVPVMNNNRAQNTVKKQLTDSMHFTNEIYNLEVSEEDKIKVMMFQSAQVLAEEEPEPAAPAFNHYDGRPYRYCPYGRPYAYHNPYKWVAPDRRN